MNDTKILNFNNPLQMDKIRCKMNDTKNQILIIHFNSIQEISSKMNDTRKTKTLIIQFNFIKKIL